MPGRHEARKEEMLHGLAEIVRDRGVRFRGWKVTIERLMLVEARDEQEHAAQLREWGGA